MERFINDNNLNILNNCQPTKITHNSQTAIDLTLCSPQLSYIFQWSDLTSPKDSDHCPIIVSTTTNRNIEPSEIKFNLKKSDWGSYTDHEVWEANEALPSDDKLKINKFCSKIVTAADATIPKIENRKFFPKPWWSSEMQILRNQRDQYKKYKNKSLANLIAWK